MTIDAVIPAFNEESGIKSILQTLKQIHEIDKIIVVDDGSSDKTFQVASTCAVEVIVHEKNRGKAAAIYTGAKKSGADYLLVLDADLICFSIDHVRQLIQPVMSGSAQCTVGIFTSGRMATDMAQLLAPYLSGQRVFPREFFLRRMEPFQDSRYGIETLIARAIIKEGLTLQKIPLAGASHTMQEEKLGWKDGIHARMRMYIQIIKALRMPI